MLINVMKELQWENTDGCPYSDGMPFRLLVLACFPIGLTKTAYTILNFKKGPFFSPELNLSRELVGFTCSLEFQTELHSIALSEITQPQEYKHPKPMLTHVKALNTILATWRWGLGDPSLTFPSLKH